METSDEKIIKEDLQKSADSYKAQLEVEVGESIEQLQKVMKLSAMVAGGVFLGYTIFKVFIESEESKDKRKKKRKHKKAQNSNFLEPVLEPVLRAGAEMATSFLLSMARRKLIEYLQDLDQTFETSNGHPQGNQ